MDFDRRLFVGGTVATIGVALGGPASPQGVLDGRKPISREQWDSIIRRSLKADIPCVLGTPATEGPFYSESSPLRRDITDRRPGMPLRLGVTVAGVIGPAACVPLAGAIVDVWHSDASGLYSNVGSDLQVEDTSGRMFLRGHQVTDEKGHVEFDTIVPGWEIIPAATPVNVAVRTTHIHVKVFSGHDVFTTQFFLPDPLLDQLYAEVEPYKSHRLLRLPGRDRRYERIRNTDDGFFRAMKAQPLPVERANGVLTAKAIIGLVGPDERQFAPLFR